MVLVWFVLTRALLPRSCVPLAALPGSTRTDLLRNDSDRPFGVLPGASAAACRVLCALGEHCRHCVVLVVLLPRVRGDALPVRPDERV